MKYLTVVISVLMLMSSSWVSAEPRNWVECYVEAAEFRKQNKLESAAHSYYRAQLASSWARELRPLAFIGDGNDPGTFRSAMDFTLGQTINPWAFENPKKRLVPLLDRLEAEVRAIKDQKQLSGSIFSGAIGSEEEERSKGYLAKYPYKIDEGDRMSRFKTFALEWIASGRKAAKQR